MKKPLYKFAYRMVSGLSDLSGGPVVFVKWKVALAAIILGLSAGAMTGCDPFSITCYDPAMPPSEEETDNGAGEDETVETTAEFPR